MHPSTTLAALVAHCRKLARPQQSTDAALLRRFIACRDATAFEELLERYASLVWGVCRRILHRETDCEDAFQATFLALVRQADSIDPDRPLGAWLHTIAVRASAKAKIRFQRQRTQAILPERSPHGDIADELGDRELFRVVDEEIARLPVLLRAPFILCCLEGRTRDEAASALGCSVAAVKSRLERSRDMLRRRLQRRGFGLPAVFLVLGLTGSQVRASLRTKALQAVLGSASPTVTALVPAAGAWLTSKLTLTAMALLMIGIIGFGAFRSMQAEPPQDKPSPVKDVAQPPVAEKPQPRLDRFGDPLPPGAVRRFGTLRFRHAHIEDLAFTPDGKRLMAGEGTKPLAVFDAMTGRKLRDVGKSSSSGVVGTFTVSADGKWVAACGEDVFLWEIETGRMVRELHYPRSRSVAFSADGKILAAAVWVAGKPEISLVEVATGKHLRKWTFKEDERLSLDLRPLAFSPDGKYLAWLVCKWRKERPDTIDPVSSQVWLMDAKTGSRVRTFGSQDALFGAFAFQPGTGRLVTVEQEGVLRFWDVDTGKESHHFSIARNKKDNKGGFNPEILRFSADGQRCAVADGNSALFVVVDARTGREVRRIELAKTAMWLAADLSRDGRTIAAASTRGYSCVRVWDVDTGIERLGDAGYRTPPILALSADERTLIGRSEDGQEIHWDRRSGQPVQRRSETPGQEGRPVRPLATAGEWTLRGPRWRLHYHFATSTLAVYSLDGDRLLGKAEWGARVHQFVVSPDGMYVAAPLSSDRQGTVLLWNPEKEKQPRRLSGNILDRCWTLLFSHDSKRLIAAISKHNANPSSTLWVWDVATTRPIHKLATNGTPGSLLLTSDDRVLISGGLFRDGTVHVWDMETGKELASFTDPPSEQQGRIGGLALSADERFLAVIFSRDDASTVSVWETGSWKAIRMFPPLPRSNYGVSMVFSRDGRSLFVSNSDTTILEWDVSARWANGQRQPAAENLNKDRLNRLWQGLAATPDRAYPAVWELLDHSAEAVPFLIDKLAPVKPIDERRAKRFLAQLDSASFAEREEANRQLLALGEQTLSLLSERLKNKPSLESKKRIKVLIESLRRGPLQEQLRLLRAMAVLEWSGTSQAGEHLRRMADGDPSARLTQAAKAAYQRLHKKSIGDSASEATQ